MRIQRGFTLIEVMIVVAIIAILSAIALPSYSDYVRRGKLIDAHKTLAEARARLEQYFQDNRSYKDGCATAVPASTDYFTYKCVDDVTTFTVTADGVATEGTGGFGFSIDQANTRVTTAVPSGIGWTKPTGNCWVTKKGGLC